PKVNLERIFREIQEFRQENKQHLDALKEDINKANQRIEEAEERIVVAEARLDRVKLAVRSMLKTQIQNEDKLVDQEARARRKNIWIFKIPENEEQGKLMIEYVEKLLREKLNLPDSYELGIERKHRALAPEPTGAAKPRSIGVQFLRYCTKEEILRKAWEKKEIYVNNQRLYFDHDYPPEYNEAKRVLREKKIRFQTPYPAKLHIFYKDETHSTEATKDMQDRGFAVQVISPCQDLMKLLEGEPWRVRERKKRSAGAAHRTKLQAFRRHPQSE
uniref:L1 transposable element RRM domain-containing protein n=1 Tax=Poecilia formosa TaxID=48698 RepID=A0A087Y0S1_POEFO